MQKYEITKPSVNDKPKRNMKGLINSFESINLLRIKKCNLNFYERELRAQGLNKTTVTKSSKTFHRNYMR